MGNKILIKDTSGNRLPKKPKANQTELTSTDGSLIVTTQNQANAPVDSSSKYFVEGMLVSNVLVSEAPIFINSNAVELIHVWLVEGQTDEGVLSPIPPKFVEELNLPNLTTVVSDVAIAYNQLLNKVGKKLN